jgi:hypothetical protein
MYKLDINNEQQTYHFPTFPQCIAFLADKDPKASIMLIKQSNKAKKPATVKTPQGNIYRFKPPIERQEKFQISEKMPYGNLKKGEGLGYKFIHS